MSNKRQPCRSTIAVLALAATVVGTLLIQLFSANDRFHSSASASLRQTHDIDTTDIQYHRQTRARGSRTALSQFSDPKSSLPRATTEAQVQPLGTPYFHVVGWNEGGKFYQIEIVHPKHGAAYSVTVTSRNKYTGTAQLLSRPHLAGVPVPTHGLHPLVYVWKPVFQLDDYEIVVHELMPNHAIRGAEPSAIIEPSPLKIAVGAEQLGDGYDSPGLLQNMYNNAPPCSTLVGKVDALSDWDGTWIGPELKHESLGNTLRTGWSFLPSPEMNCRVETFSTEDLLSIPPGPNGEAKSIYVLGTSVMRGVFLSLVDLLLPSSDKAMLHKSVVNNCWGRAELRKGNMKLLYQDFRIQEFEQPHLIGEDLVECHNNVVVKEGAKFLHSAMAVWEEVFNVNDPTQWPNVIFMVSGYAWHYDNFDFETHTLQFVKNLPPSWDGTLIFADGQFSGSLAGLKDIHKYEEYRAGIREMIGAMNDPRVRWLDGMGVAKEHRMYTEAGPEYIAGSAHFHSQCPPTNGPITYLPSGETTDSNPMHYCSNVTEVVAQTLIGHALGPKGEFVEQVKQFDSHLVGANAKLETCTACPKSLRPFHLTPNPELSCSSGPLHPKARDEVVLTEPPRACPESCLNRDPDWSFPSQSDTVYVRNCVPQ